MNKKGNDCLSCKCSPRSQTVATFLPLEDILARTNVDVNVRGCIVRGKDRKEGSCGVWTCQKLV